MACIAPAGGEAPAPDAAAQIGRSVVVVNDVDGQFGDAPAKHIAVDDDIVFEEDITTGNDARAMIEFRDGSTFEVGPNAAVRIDSFVFNPEESTSHKALQVGRGVFRYVSAFAASDQETKIATPAGSMAIRGSVAAGIVDPELPDFIFLGEGSATFANTAGSSTLQAGNAIAVPSATTPPMAPEAMPAPVAAQAMQAIMRRLPPQPARRPADEAWLKRAGAADLVPVAEQQRLAGAAATNRPLPSTAGRGGIARELSLLVEANRVALFSGRQTTRTPEQAAFIARAARDNPTAPSMMQRYKENSRAMHTANVAAGTALVMRGVGRAAPSATVMQRVTAAAVRANPGAAGLIQRHAKEAYRGPDRAELDRRPAAARQAAPYAGVHPPNDFERRQPEHPAVARPGGRPPGANVRPPAERRPVQAPPRQLQQRPAQPQKGQPQKQQQRKKDERDQQQR